MQLAVLQDHLRSQSVDGWLLYNFRDLNPIAISVAGLPTGGTRRWFLWIPAEGEPRWLVHAIESHMFHDARPELHGAMARYVGWQELPARLVELIGPAAGSHPRILMEYSPDNAIPFTSRIDAGIKELVERATRAEIRSSADIAQLALAVLDDEQIASHRRAVDVCLAIKDAAFALVAQRLREGQTVTEYDVQRFIRDQFIAARCEPIDTIVAVNAHAADPHYHPSATVHSEIRPGDMLLIDLWSRETAHPVACMADITWTGYCGVTVPAEVASVFAVVRAGRDRAVQFIEQQLAAGRPVHGYEVDDACRAVLAAAGYGDYFIHRTGHSLGPTGHWLGVNLDNLETQDRRALLPRLLFTVEPGIYMPINNFDAGPTPKGLGIRSEINCLMHPGRVEVTTLPLQTEVLALLA